MNSNSKKISAFSLLKVLVFISLLFSPLFVPVSSAFAHKVYLFAWIDGDTVYTDSYFSSKKKVHNGTIRVLDKGNELLQGKTNEKGEFSFKIPDNIGNKALKLILESSMGHRAEYLLTGEDISGYQDDSEQSTDNTVFEKASSLNVNADMTVIKEMMEEVVDARLKPVTRALAKIQEEKGPGITEIVGGIGYIIGIMGIALYFRSRRKQ